MDSSCKTIASQISDYVDGMVTADTAWTIDMHLTTCRDCAELAQGLRRTVSLLSQAEPKRLSEQFDSRLAQKLAAIDARSGRSRRNWAQLQINALAFQLSASRSNLKLRMSLAAAALCAVCLGLFVPHAAMNNSAGGQARTAVSAKPLSGIVDSTDQAFIAACVSEQSQTSDEQTLVDPAAQALAAQPDVTTVSNVQPTPTAGPGQD